MKLIKSPILKGRVLITRDFSPFISVLKTRSNSSSGLEDTGAVQKFRVESGEKTSCYNGRTLFSKASIMGLFQRKEDKKGKEGRREGGKEGRREEERKGGNRKRGRKEGRKEERKREGREEERKGENRKRGRKEGRREGGREEIEGEGGREEERKEEERK
ncbi:hypothetical protein L345_05476, partial [Ophiophagus hannah]